MGAVVELDPRSIAATPGAPAVVAVRLRNTGTVVDQFTLDVVGDAAAWATIDPPSVSLFPGAEGSTTLSFTPPRSPAVRAGRVPFGLRVQSKEDPAGSTVEEGSVEVAPFTEVTAELVPRTSRGSTGATHDLAVDNRGNVPLSAAISAIDPDRLLGFDLRPPVINADPGVAAFSKIRVSPQKRFWRGAAVTRPFNVQVALPGGEPQSLDGSLLQTALLPPWTMRALIAAVGLLVALVLAWALLLKPAIESSAREQAEDVLAAVGITLPPSGGPGPSGGGGGASASPGDSGGASASPDSSTGATTAPTTAPTTPPLGEVTPVDGRLVSGGEARKPAPGTSLYITDLVFSNTDPSAAGEIRLQRSGTTLFA
ncbi:MAG TPA: hypothetical protein VFP56_03770, partial [Candidatus Limnocylindrales bacterium]|nr:hypothetical protein [Candidatus Limnocylindrales bacterium]